MLNHSLVVRSHGEPAHEPTLTLAARRTVQAHPDQRPRASDVSGITANGGADHDLGRTDGRDCPRMVPVTFGDCFGWLHPGAGMSGVVICGPIGFEKQVFHRSLRVLADRLAEAGHPTVRFDYPGTGDAAGVEATPSEHEAWLDGIDAAVAWLREHAGVQQVVLCGVELGALLAGVAAARMGGVDRLILIAPVNSGRTYARTFQLAARLRTARRSERAADRSDRDEGQGTDQDAGTGPSRSHETLNWADACGRPAHIAQPAGALAASQAMDEVVEAHGLRLHATTLRALARLDLSRLPTLPARDILLLDATGLDAIEALGAAFVDAGSRLTRLDMPDYINMARQPHESEAPITSFARILTWLHETDAPADPRFPLPYPVAATLTNGQWIERPVVLEHRDGLTVGILCQPAVSAEARCGPGIPRDPVAVLIVNTGANPHYGYGRFAVTLARALAGDGVMSLRLDLAGLGDSVLRDPHARPHLFSDRSSDIAAGLAFLESQGSSTCVGFGICSGAFQIFRAAQSDRRLCGLVLVNQPVYRSPTATLIRGRLRAIRRWLRGRPAPAVGEALERLRLIPPVRKRTRLEARLIRVTRALENAMLRPLGLHVALSTPRRRFAEFAARRVNVLVVAGDDDPAHLILQAHFGPELEGLRRLAGIRALIEPEFEHPVGDADSQRRLLTATREFLGQFRGRNGDVDFSSIRKPVRNSVPEQSDERSYGT